MVVNVLSSERIDSGEFLIKRADENGLRLSSAFWFYMQEDSIWKLLISTSDLDKKGPKFVYGKLQKIIERNNLREDLPLSDIGLINSREPILSLMKSAISTGDSISRIRFTGNVVDGVLIPDALIYRIS